MLKIINIHNPALTKAINIHGYTNKEIVTIVNAYSNSKDFIVDMSEIAK
jgi:hypothetical protein